MSRQAPGTDRAPRLAALATAVPMAGVVGFWLLLGLLAGNGLQGDASLLPLVVHLGAGLLAMLLAPWLACHLCRHARRHGWGTPAAVLGACLAATCAASVALAAAFVLVAALITGG